MLDCDADPQHVRAAVDAVVTTRDDVYAFDVMMHAKLYECNRSATCNRTAVPYPQKVPRVMPRLIWGTARYEEASATPAFATLAPEYRHALHSALTARGTTPFGQLDDMFENADSWQQLEALVQCHVHPLWCMWKLSQGRYTADLDEALGQTGRASGHVAWSVSERRLYFKYVYGALFHLMQWDPVACSESPPPEEAGEAEEMDEEDEEDEDSTDAGALDMMYALVRQNPNWTKDSTRKDMMLAIRSGMKYADLSACEMYVLLTHGGHALALGPSASNLRRLKSISAYFASAHATAA